MEYPKHFITHPAVFAVGEDYQIMIPTEAEVIVKIRVGDKLYYDDYMGIIRSHTTMHKVTLPMFALDCAGGYTVVYRKMIERLAYFPTSEEEIEVYYSFKPLPEEGDIRIFHISDAHNLRTQPVNACRNFGDIDLLILNGDIPDEASAPEKYMTIYEIASDVTEGTLPIVCSRGNHDNRGMYSENIADYLPTEGGRTYYTFSLGRIFGLVLDCGEDKDDSHKAYGSTVCFHDFRERETAELQRMAEAGELYAPDKKYRLCICHIPFTNMSRKPFDIEDEIYTEWSRITREYLKPQLLIYGHEHVAEIWRKGERHDTRGQACDAVIGGYPMFRSAGYDETGYTGAGIVLSDNKAHISFVNSFDEVIGEYEIEL